MQLKQLARRVLERFDRGARRAAIARGGFDHEVEKNFRSAGLYGLLIPEAAGGSGLGPIELLAVSEEIGRQLAPVRILGSAVMFAVPLIASGQAAWHGLLRAVADGETHGALATFETDVGWWGAPRTIARRRRAGFTLTGEKAWVLGEVDDAMRLVLADVSGEGSTLFAVPGAIQGADATAHRSVHLTSRDMTLQLTDVDVGNDTVVGTVGGGGHLIEAAYSAAVIAVAGEAIGGSETLLEMTLAYANQRVQFGKPIAAFQAVKHRCAEMKLALEQLRALAYFSAWRAQEAGYMWTPLLSALKACVCTSYERIARDAVQIHGGIGFTWEHDLQLYLRHAVYLDGFLGRRNFHLRRLGEAASMDPDVLELADLSPAG